MNSCGNLREAIESDEFADWAVEGGGGLRGGGAGRGGTWRCEAAIEKVKVEIISGARR